MITIIFLACNHKSKLLC